MLKLHNQHVALMSYQSSKTQDIKASTFIWYSTDRGLPEK